MKCHDCGCGEMKNYLDDERDFDGDRRLAPGEWRCEDCGFTVNQLCDRPFSTFNKHVQDAVVYLSRKIRRAVDLSPVLDVCQGIANEFPHLEFTIDINENGGFVSMETWNASTIGEFAPILRALARAGYIQKASETCKDEMRHFWLIHPHGEESTCLYLDASFRKNAKCEKVQVGEKTVPVFKWNCDDKALEREMEAATV